MFQVRDGSLYHVSRTRKRAIYRCNPASKSPPLLQPPPVFSYLCCYSLAPSFIFYFKMKLITYLKSANRVMHTHLVLRTTFHNKQMMSSSGASMVLTFRLGFGFSFGRKLPYHYFVELWSYLFVSRYS